MINRKILKSEDSHVSCKEARKFLKENNLKELSKKDVLKFLQQYAINTENVKDTKVVEKDGQKTIHLTYKDGTQEVINPDKKDVLKFLQQYAINTENVKDTKVVEKDGQKTIHLTYKDGTQEVINPDRSSNITQSDENGNTTTRFLDENKKLLKDSVTAQNGDTVETTYEEDGQTPSSKVSTENETGNTTVVNYENGKPAKEVVTDNTKNSVSTTNYEEGQPKTKTVEVGKSTVSNYSIDEQGNERLESKVENKGIEAKEKRTDYTYNDDGTVTANIKEAGKDTVQQIKDGKVQSEVIKEKDKTTTRTFAEDGSGTEIVEESNGNTSTTNFNADGHKLSQTKTVNGKTYNVEYDGKGNTKVVLQNGESIDALAKKFGTTKKAILEANGGKVRGWAGDDLVVPGELSADAKALQGRDSKEVAQAKYKAFAEQQKQMKDAAQADLEARVGMSWTEKKHNTYEKLARGLFANEGNKNPNKYEMQLRINELKKLNPNIKDGELVGKKVNVTVSKEFSDGFNSRQIGRERTAMAAKAKHEANTGKTLANAMYKGLDDNAGGVSSKEFQNALAKVNKDNVLGVIEQYNKISPDESLIEGIMDETGNTMKTRRAAETKIINALIERAKSSGISDERAKQQLNDCVNELSSYWSMGVGYCSTEKLDGLVKNVIGAIHTAEAMTKTEKRLAAKDNAMDDTIGIMNESLSENKANLQKQLDQDGWCADLYEGLKWCVGSDNLDENVKADLKTFEKSMGELDKARKSGGEAAWCADLYEGLKWCVGSDNLDENVKADLKTFEKSMGELDKARKSGGEAAFKTKFKEIFGVEYDPNLAKGYRKLQSNLANAQALTVQLDGFNKEFANSINGKESYGNMVAKYGSYLQSVSSEVQDGKDVAEKSIALAMQKDGIDFAKATDAQKAKYLQNIIKQTQNGISSKINEYTRGKDLATLENDLKYASTAVFGNKGDIVNRVNSYVNSQQVGGAVVNGAVKAVGAIAIAVATGGTGLVALSTAALATTALSAATDLTDRASSNVGLQDGEVTNILKNATIDGATVFAGGQLTKAAMALKSSKAFIQAGGRMLAQSAGDVAIGAAAEYGQTGEITLQGVTFQAVFSAAGNLVALKQLAKGTKPAGDVAIGAAAEYGQTGEITLQGVTFQAVFSAAGNLVALKQLAKGTKPATKSNPTPDAPKSTLDVATTDGAKIPGGKLGTEKMNKVKDEVKAELPDATPERGAQIHKEADQLQAQSREQGREVKHMVEDEFGVVTIGKEHIDISTADVATIERLHKEVSGWSTDTRNKAEILKKLEDRMVELHVSPESPNVTRGSEFVDRINTNANQSATDILAGNPGALPPHDAAILKEHLTNNLNTADEIQGFMDALKKRVGVNEKGNMHVYEVQGVDQAADVMKSAEAKLAKIKARQADVAATNSAADAAINGSRGLNEQEFATIKSFVERTDSAEDLQALIKKFENNKCLRNSQASKKLFKTMKEKSDILQAKANAPKVVASEQNGVEPQGTVKPKETYVDPHHITLDKAPESAAPAGKTFEGFESVQRKLASEQPSAPAATPANASREVDVDPHHITLDEAPKGSVPEGQTADFMAAHQQLQQKPHDDLVAMLNEKARTGKGLNQTEFNQVNDYISTITDEAQLKELKGLLAGKKMTSAQKKQLKEAINNKEKALNSVANPDAGTPATKSKDNVEAPKVSKESIDADVKSIADSEIPSVQRKLWSDCKQRISDITNELSAPFKGNKAAMVAKCKTLFADLKTIAAKSSESVRQKINNLMQKIRTMMSENKLIKNQAENTPVRTSDVTPASVNSSSSQKYVLTPEQRERVNDLFEIYHENLQDVNYLRQKYPQYKHLTDAQLLTQKYVLTPEQRERVNDLFEIYHENLQDVNYLRQKYPQYKHLTDAQLLNEFKLDETHAAFIKNRKDLFADGANRYSERPYWSDSPYELTNNHSAWKMHLFSVSELDYQQMAEVVLPYLNKNKIAHKTLSSTMSPELLCKTAPKQAGKAFTIYPQSPQEMEKIARDLDKLIKEHNLQTTNSKITGDNQLGNSGRLFYRYELPSGSMKDNIYKPGEHIPYEANRGDGKYLASDMTPADDPWLNFDPSNPNSKPNISKSESVQPKVVQAAPEDVEIISVEPARVDDVEVISVEPARVGDVEVLDMGDMPPFMIRTFNAYSSQIDNVTSLRELNQIENSIV